MKFIFSNSKLPDNPNLILDINNAGERLYGKLINLRIDDLDISDYNKKYLGNKLQLLRHIIQLNSYILAWSVYKSHPTYKDITFIEYGGGTGMLSLIAKELGIGTVIYNDIYSVSCADAKALGQLIGIEADYYVNGDIEDVISFCIKENICCDAIASYDVIEHIYDIESFFRELPKLTDGPLSIFMSSGANSANPIINKKEINKQKVLEYQDREKTWGHKDRDSLRSYLKIRQDIILDYCQAKKYELSEIEISSLAKMTRGLIKNDIIDAIDRYISSGIKPQELSHPTNTCDPLNGNWAEHLMDPQTLANILIDSGFKTKVFGGYYGHNKDFIKNTLVKILNGIISLSGNQGIRFAPFYTIYGQRS